MRLKSCTNLHTKLGVFCTDLLNVVTVFYPCFIPDKLFWFLGLLFKQNYSSCIFKSCPDFTLSTSCCAQLACPPQSKIRIYPLGLPVKLILQYSRYRCFNSGLRKTGSDLALQTLAPCPRRSWPCRRWGQGCDTGVVSALKFHCCCSSWSENKHSGGLSNHSHFHQSSVLTPAV